VREDCDYVKRGQFAMTALAERSMAAAVSRVVSDDPNQSAKNFKQPVKIPRSLLAVLRGV
jgi:hypothetical protein